MTNDHVLATRIARYYVRRVWHADFDDCYQEAHVAILLARRTYDPAKGNWSSYAMSAASRQVRQLLYRSGSPVSGRSGYEAVQLTGLHSIEASPILLDAVQTFGTINSTDDELIQAELYHRVTDAVLQVSAKMRPASCLAVRDVLLEDLTPAQAAVKRGIDAETVSLAVRRARRLVKDQYLNRLTAAR